MTETLDDLALRAAWRTRRWTANGLADLGVGFDGERFLLSITHADGHPAHVERYALPGMRNGTDRKMLAPKGATRDLFPAPERFNREVPIVITEGAPAAITLCCADVPATGVPAMTIWRPEWAQRFAERSVIVMPDAETKARQSFERIAADILPYAHDVRLFDVYPGREDGADIGDYLLELVPAGAGPVQLVSVAIDLISHALEFPPLERPRDYQVTSFGRGKVELERDDADPLKFEPASVLSKAQRLIEVLVWQADERPYGFKDEHAREIAFVVRLLCGPHRELSDTDETLGIVDAYTARAVAVEGHTLHGTVGQRYEALKAMRRDLDGVTGRPIGPARYLIDAETDELVIPVGELQTTAREQTGTSLPHGWLDARIESIGWIRLLVQSYAPESGRRQADHIGINVYRGSVNR
jgi:hypothetical protein